MNSQYVKRAKVADYKIGDKVLFKIKAILAEQNKRFAPKFATPYRIVKVALKIQQ